MRRLSQIVCLLLFVSAATLLADSVIADGVISTSLVRLLAHPEKYNGKRVEVIGYYHSAFEESGLYLTKDDAMNSNTESGLWIGGIAKGADTNRVHRVKEGFVRVAGTFSYSPKSGAGHMGLWPAELKDITFFNTTKPEKRHE
jgi:ABC-type enterobactin transport system permease subunit